MIEVDYVLTVVHLRDDLLISGLLIAQILDMQLLPPADSLVMLMAIGACGKERGGEDMTNRIFLPGSS